MLTLRTITRGKKGPNFRQKQGYVAFQWSFIFFAKLNQYNKLFRASFKLEIFLGYLYKRKGLLDQMGSLSFP